MRIRFLLSNKFKNSNHIHLVTPTPTPHPHPQRQILSKTGFHSTTCYTRHYSYIKGTVARNFLPTFFQDCPLLLR